MLNCGHRCTQNIVVPPQGRWNHANFG